MPNNPTPARIPLNDVWVDLYAASGITVGSQLLVSIESGNEILLCEADSEPDINSTNIFYLPATQKQVIVDVNSIGLWARSVKGLVQSHVLVQEDYIAETGGGA